MHSFWVSSQFDSGCWLLLFIFKMTYEDMITQACASMGGKFMSRAMIKTYLTKNFGYVDSAMAKNHLKKALAKFERKGDSFRVSKAMKQKGAVAEKKKLAMEKAAAKKAAQKQKAAAKKAALAAKKQAKKTIVAAKKAAAAAKKKALKEKRAAQKAAKKSKKAAKKTKKVVKKKTAKKAAKKPVKKAAKKTAKKTAAKK